MSNLWRTQRPRFPLYQSDGFGRDYYIKYTNGGYWENQFFLRKKPDYERPKYNNFHSLYHLAAPVKYNANGSGRENYILQFNGFHHDQKPLFSYQLTDFLRNERYIKLSPKYLKKKAYLSVAEAKYNKKLKKQIKDLNEDISSFENSMNKSKKTIKSDRRNTSIGHLTSSANKNNTSCNNSDIKSFLFKRKIKAINISKIKNKTNLNKSLREHHKKVTSFGYVNEFSVHSNKKSHSKNRSNQNSKNKTKVENNSKNKDMNYKKDKIEQKDAKKRRIQSNNIYDYSHFKKVPPI